jgi:hypothetical protein
MLRCFVCGRRWRLHGPWRRRRCVTTPLPVQVVAHLPWAEAVKVEAG